MSSDGYRGKRKKPRKWFSWSGPKKKSPRVPSPKAPPAKKVQPKSKPLPSVPIQPRTAARGPLEEIAHRTLASYEDSSRSGDILELAESLDDMAERFASLNQMITDVNKRMNVESEEFEELKFSEYMKFQETPEEDSYELESMDTNPDLVRKRSELGRTILLLSNLETNRSVLKSQLTAAILAMQVQVQRRSFNVNPILKELEKMLQEAESVVNHATSDGEMTPEEEMYYS